jgi:hypothetical protein
MKINEANTLAVQFIQVWCFDDGVAMTGKVTVSLVIGHDKDHIGFVHFSIPAWGARVSRY